MRNLKSVPAVLLLGGMASSLLVYFIAMRSINAAISILVFVIFVGMALTYRQMRMAVNSQTQVLRRSIQRSGDSAKATIENDVKSNFKLVPEMSLAIDEILELVCASASRIDELANIVGIQSKRLRELEINYRHSRNRIVEIRESLLEYASTLETNQAEFQVAMREFPTQLGAGLLADEDVAKLRLELSEIADAMRNTMQGDENRTREWQSVENRIAELNREVTVSREYLERLQISQKELWRIRLAIEEIAPLGNSY